MDLLLCWGLKEHFYDVIKLDQEEKHFYEAFSDCLTVICGIRKKVVAAFGGYLKIIFIYIWFTSFIKYHIKLFVGIKAALHRS